MNKLVRRYDELAGIDSDRSLIVWPQRCAFGCLILMVLSSPNSIAATQTGWLLGMAFWAARYFFKPRPKFIKTFLLVPMLAFAGWSLISSVFSYAPDISIGRLPGEGLFLIFFFVINHVRTLRAAHFLAFLLIVSCMVTVVWVPIERFLGRGVEIHGVSADSPFTKDNILDGDTLLTANGKKITTPEDLVNEIERSETTKIVMYRPDFYWQFDLKKSDLVKGNSALEKLGITSWKKSVNWRSSGFFGHYATYAEVLQLIISLTFGLLIASLGIRRQKRRIGDSELVGSENFRVSRVTIVLFVSVLLMGFALLLTSTRASQGAFLVSAFFIVVFGAGRKILLILLAASIPIVIVGAIYLQQSRGTGFVDPSDSSTTWRQTVYREGFELWTKNLRHFTLGVGMDSKNRYAKQWHLFDDGKLPPGHFHSTPLQLVVERGFPALIFWLWILGAYVRSLLKAIRANTFSGWVDKGIVLGSFGGAIGFFMSGLVHYNLGDSEVAMVFFILMGISVSIVSREVD